MPKIRNETRKAIIADGFVFCRTPWHKACGLMFTQKMEKPLLFVFGRERMWGLHMLFVFYPIDVIFLDREKKVVDLKEDFRPWAFCTPRQPCLYIIEVPRGTIKRSKTSLGDRIEF